MSQYNYTPANYFVSSLLSEEMKQEDIKEKLPEIAKMDNVLEYGYLYSIELRRNEIKRKLSEFFVFDDDKTMLEFLAANNDVLQALPHLAKFIITHLNDVNKLSISLLNENPTWKTLFVNIFSNANWAETNKLSTELFNILFESPSVFDKVNINFCQE
jgi:hypothetical protein